MRLVGALLLGALMIGCGGSASSTSAPTTIHLTSSAFAPGGAIPRQYTCDGRDVSLPLSWSGIPRAARELVLVIRDPDAPGGNFIHWALAGIPPSTTSIGAGQAPPGAVQGTNGFGAVGYRGPCPPTGAPAHHYVMTLSALANPSGLGRGFSASQVPGSPLATGTLTGTYGRR